MRNKYVVTSNEYPIVGIVLKKNRNTQRKCVCGELAKFATHIQFSYFRGDDDVIWSCEEHKRNVVALTGINNYE